MQQGGCDMMRRAFFGIMATMFLSIAGCGFAPFIGPIISIGLFWVNGEAHKYYDAEQLTVLNAVKGAAEELDFIVVSEEEDGNVIYVKLNDRSVPYNAESVNRFHVRIIKIQNNVTKLSIRVNTLGDKPYAELIYRKVDQYPGVKCFHSEKELERAYYGRRR
jgi:hypothetical protein